MLLALTSTHQRPPIKFRDGHRDHSTVGMERPNRQGRRITARAWAQTDRLRCDRDSIFGVLLQGVGRGG